MTIKTSTLSLLIDALEALRKGRNVLIVARERLYAFKVAGLLVRLARYRNVPCANVRGAAMDTAWVYARGQNDPIELLAKDCDVFYDASVPVGRQLAAPPTYRRVDG